MEKVLNWFTKKKIISLGLVGSIGFVFLIQKTVSNFVYETFGASYFPVLDYLIVSTMFAVAVFLLSPMFFFATEKIFFSWKKTLFIYLFIYLFIMIFIPRYSGDEFFHITKGMVAIFLLCCYILFSVIYIFNRNHKVKSE